MAPKRKTTMAIWAIADLHLSFGVPNKKMDVFGENWVNHTGQVEKHWKGKISPDDLILIAGDISWAKHIEDAMPDLEWIASLPGTKVMIRGNHDYWWASRKKVEDILPDSIHIIHNDHFIWNDYAICGARLWDTPEFNFDDVVPYKENPCSTKEAAAVPAPADCEKIYLRELGRLEMSLKSLKDDGRTRVAMTHYPPVYATMEPSRAQKILKNYNIETCVFGHLHNALQEVPLFGTRDGIRYILTAADYIHFNPVLVYE